MPELPEVEVVRRDLERGWVGRRIERVVVRRADVVRLGVDAGVTDETVGAEAVKDDRLKLGDEVARRGEVEAALLLGDGIADVRRHGKQLAIVGSSGRVVSVHLGMSGKLLLRREEKGGEELEPSGQHVHVIWMARIGTQWLNLQHEDPRRFGGVWCYPSMGALVQHRWSKLGPDGLVVTAGELLRNLSKTQRQLKAALLDQSVVAGLGNIYVDEVLFRAKLSPLMPANRVDKPAAARVVRWTHKVLGQAIEAGGSTLRDYVDTQNQQGGYQHKHQVYGRAGLPCPHCGEALEKVTVAARTTVYCKQCQASPK